MGLKDSLGRPTSTRSRKAGGQLTLFQGEEKPMESSVSRAGSSYPTLLEGILSNPKSIQVAANLSALPRASNAISETRDSVFYCFSGNSKQSIEKLLSRKSPRSKPRLSNYSKPKKILSATWNYPTLGLDSTLPQRRSSSSLSLDTTLPQH